MKDRCVCCDAELPEGYGCVCRNCENASSQSNPIDAVKKRISFSYGKNPCIHIKNSYLIRSNEDIRMVLEYIHGMDEYKKLQEDGYTRTMKSEYREWKVHNLFYRLGILRACTGTTDIAQKESMLRRFGYAILSIF